MLAFLVELCIIPRCAVSSIAVVKPEKAQMVEMMLLRMYQSGQIQGKVCITRTLHSCKLSMWLYHCGPYVRPYSLRHATAGHGDAAEADAGASG